MKKILVINEQIQFDKILVIDTDGKSLGIIDKKKALELADERQLDLYLVPGSTTPPVAKFGDVSKILYEQEKKLHKQKKNTKVIVLKTITLSIRISLHDLNIKLDKGKKFLVAGNKLEVIMKLRKKEMQDEDNIKKAKLIFEKNIIPELVELGTIEKPLAVSGTCVKIMFTANKNKGNIITKT